MSLGSAVRRALGPWEPAAIRVYRELFIDLDSLAVTVGSVAPQAKRILEVGCGDGAMAAALRRVLPDTTLLGLDPGMAEPGRMYDGESAGVEFRRISTAELIAENPEPFDLVMLCDVVHHVTDEQRAAVLRDAAALTAPGGTVAVKEWEHRGGMGTAVAFVADRGISGDAGVRFMPRAELDELLAAAMPGWETTCEARIPPRRANLLLTLRRPA
ncbi:MAG TPA: class I SAM-dependent methyltransferase [Pseudonocardiaceae bacterium]|nr:class I SAM-dependent methyltransferase [Pseudonocardiaceae bacterium]